MAHIDPDMSGGDEGMFNTAPVAALEPANGYYDSMEKAICNQRIAMLAAEQEEVWTLQVRLSNQK